VKFLRKLFGLDRPVTPAAKGRGREFDLKGLERVLKYQFRNPELARTALTHRSYLHASQGRSGESNERMEFLGDSVVGLAVNQFLYNKFPKLREGELTKMKSLLVSRVILSRTANLMGLGHYVLLSDAENESGGRNRASILADTLEGVIGAVYLDGGLEPARLLTERLLLKEVHEILSDANLANYKSMLQEYVQGEFKTHPQYRISSENGPDHHKLFAVDVVVNGRSLGRGHGSNKKEAEQEAARDALLHFERIVRSEKSGGGGGGGGQRRRSRRGGRGRRSRGGEGRPDETRDDAAPRGPREPRDGRGLRGGREGREGRERREPRERVERRDHPREGREGQEHGERPATGGDNEREQRPEGNPPEASGSPPWAASRLHTEP
jgi:ribonuclease-3